MIFKRGRRSNKYSEALKICPKVGFVGYFEYEK